MCGCGRLVLVRRGPCRRAEIGAHLQYSGGSIKYRDRRVVFLLLRRAQSSRTDALGAEIRRRFGQTMLVKLGQRLANVDPTWPMLAVFWSTRSDLTSMSPSWTNLGRLWPNLANADQTLANVDQHLTNIGQFRSAFTNRWPHPARLGKYLAQIGP